MSTVVLRRAETNETLGRRTVSLDAQETGTVTLDVSLRQTGTTTLNVDGYTTTVRVFDPAARSIPPEVPTRGPPGATLLVPVAAPNGSFVSGATVSLAGESYETGREGVAVVQLPTEPGTYQLRVVDGGAERSTRDFTIEAGATRQLSGRLGVTPQTGNALTRPRVEVQVANPWGSRLNRTVTLVAPRERTTRTVELAGGEATRVNVSTSEAGLDQRFPPGSYALRLESSVEGDGTGDGETRTLATATYRVRGDDRLLSLVASEGSYAAGTPVGQAIENVFGNVQVLFGAIVFLAGLATVGGTTAAFAHAVHARRRTIGIRRATGATPAQVLRLLVADACRLAVPSTLVAVVVAVGAVFLLEGLGLLVVFGIRLAVPVVPWLLAMVAAGAVALSVVGVVAGGVGFLLVSPAGLLRARE